MSESEHEHGAEKPSEQRGGTVPDEAEARDKGEWAGRANEGLVPAELGGSDAPREMLPDDPQLDSSVLGRPAESGEPATDDGVDGSAGDNADAVTDGGSAAGVPEGVEPDLKDAPAVANQGDDPRKP
jgi:hypothetical protein